MREISTTRKLLFSSAIVLMAVLALEGALRVRQMIRYGAPSTGVRDPMLVFDDEAGVFVPKPGYEISGGRINIKINSLGFRGDEFSREKPPGLFRIVVLGASTTFNMEVSSNHATWPHQLQEKLRAAYPDRQIEVINASVGGYTSAELLKVLRHRVLPLDPDLVIYYEANNEIVRDTQQLAIKEGVAGPNRQSAFVRTMSSYSLTFDLAYKNLAILLRSRDTSSKRLDSVPANLPDHFVQTLDEMRAELAQRNIPIVLSTFIVKYRRNQDRSTQLANADVAFYYMPWMSIDGMLNAMDTYNNAVLEYGRRANVPVVDDRESIPADAAHFTDCMHLADKGAERMADRFFRFLNGSVLLAGHS